MPKAKKTSTNPFVADCKRRHAPPLWAGPAGAGPQGGVTNSLLSRYLGCKERFRLRVIDGWAEYDRFNPRIEYGNMWHVCEQALAAGTHWEAPLVDYVQVLLERYPMSRDEIALWGDKCVAFFPVYVDHWHAHPDVQNRTPLLQEQTFDVPYTLPSGRTVRLRGKWDSVDLIGGLDGSVWLQENKTKSAIDTVKLYRQLTFDLQTMLYLVALEMDRSPEKLAGLPARSRAPIAGVRYNVIRRPAHKSVESALKKLGEDQRAGRVGEWFSRIEVKVATADLEKFRTTCLDPLLESLLDDYEWWCHCRLRDGLGSVVGLEPGMVWEYDKRLLYWPEHRARHFRYPFGVYNPLEEGGSSDLDSLIDTGSAAGLRRLDTLFPELASP